MREGMSTEEQEADRLWSAMPAHLRPTLGWEAKLAGTMVGLAVAFAGGIAFEDQAWQAQHDKERAEYRAAVRACNHDLTTGYAVAKEDGWIECRALIPRLQNMDRALEPSPKELKRFLLQQMKGEQHERRSER